MLKRLPKKAWLAIGIGVLVAVAAVTTILIVKNKDKSYRIIKVYDLIGQATVERGTDNIIEVYKDMRLQSQDIVNTSTDSYLQLKLDDDKYILLEPLTEIYLEATGNKRDSKTKIYLKKGAIVKCIEDKLSDSSEYKIETPNSTIAVRGTTFRVELVFDEKGESHTFLSVFEGKVDCNLIFPDGSIDEETVSATTEQQVEILGTDVTSMYVVKDGTVEYEEYEDEVLEFLKVTIDRGKELPVTKEELDEIINSRGVKPDEPTTEPATDEPDTEETTTGESTTEETTTEESTIEGSATEKPTTEGTSSEQTTTVATEESTTAVNVEGTFTVTFKYNGSVFATQRVEAGNTATRPTFKPALTGDWDYNFNTPVTRNVTVVWVE